MPKKHLEDDFAEPGPSPEKSSKQNSDDPDGVETEKMEVSVAVVNNQEEIGNISQRFLNVIWNGHSIETIYDSFMNDIINDPIMLDTYQQLDMVNLMFKTKPDFPYPNIAWIVKKRFSKVEKSVKNMLTQTQAAFIIHLSLVLHDRQQFILVEVSYLSEKKQRNIILLACIGFLDDFIVQRKVYEVISTFEISDKCFLVCGMAEELNPTVSYVRRKMFWNRNNIAEYISTDGKLTQENMENLKYSLVRCIERVKLIEDNFTFNNKPNQQQILIDNLIENIELDSLDLEMEMREIHKNPDTLRYYSTCKTKADLLCVKVIRKIRGNVNDLKINLENLFETLKLQHQSIEVNEENVGFSMISLNVNKVYSIVRWRKVLESSLVLLNNYSELQKWATKCLLEDSNTKTINKFYEFAMRLTPKIEAGLWTQVFIIQQWIDTVGIHSQGSNNHLSSSINS